MTNLNIFCSTIKYLKILEKLPSYITPIGLGDNRFPDQWLTEKKGEIISYLNKHYGQLTMFYWLWKNKINEMNNEDFIGSCEHRLLWLNQLYEKKQKYSFDSLYSKLLSPNNAIFKNLDLIQLKPTTFKNRTVLEDFEECHNTKVLKDLLEYLPSKDRDSFSNHLNQNVLYIGPMFITKVKYFREYCELIFPWVDKCYELTKSQNLLNGYNNRLPVFLAERLTSYWITKFKKRTSLSFARLGDFHLSNTLNSLVNTTKLPLTFRQFPTLYKY